jgi:hypothetical protein
VSWRLSSRFSWRRRFASIACLIKVSVVGAELGGANSGFDGAVSRDHDDFRRVLDFADLLQRVQTVHSGKPNVEQNGIEGALAQKLEASLTALRRLRLITFVFQHALERMPDRGFIIYDENVMHARRRRRLRPR